ncbi:hypothetical protein [Micromonospora sp. AMSO31t]|uniref:hypothetical protein n=1 Tax=Micromonospora sp. AMSO31t TaxID=2650566 RepID=UPI00272E9CCE|nr:hypothetical protein [Micromonospora sp. AMSO31t]
MSGRLRRRHQLRLLKNLGLVAGERHGRSIVYALYDHHVAELLDQAIFTSSICGWDIPTPRHRRCASSGHFNSCAATPKVIGAGHAGPSSAV